MVQCSKTYFYDTQKLHHQNEYQVELVILTRKITVKVAFLMGIVRGFYVSVRQVLSLHQ